MATNSEKVLATTEATTEATTSDQSQLQRRRFYDRLCRCVRKLKWKDRKIDLLNGLTIGNKIPSVIYKTDLQLMFVVAAVYATLVAQFQQVANQEATGDIGSGRNFKVNSDFTNHYFRRPVRSDFVELS